MTLYQHRFLGHTAMGETFMYSWWVQSARNLAAAQAAAVAWNAALWNGASAGNGYKDHVTAGVGMDTVTTVQVDMLTGLQSARVDTAQSIVGVAVGSAMPGDVALVVSLRTALANRSGRGRFYLPQPAASQLTTTGKVLADLISDIGSSLSAGWAVYNSGLDRPVVYSRTHKSTNNITTFDIGDLYDTQRRRENKVLEARTSTTMP
jgi:hypothetical protein